MKWSRPMYISLHYIGISAGRLASLLHEREGSQASKLLTWFTCLAPRLLRSLLHGAKMKSWRSWVTTPSRQSCIFRPPVTTYMSMQLSWQMRPDDDCAAVFLFLIELHDKDSNINQKHKKYVFDPVVINTTSISSRALISTSGDVWIAVNGAHWFCWNEAWGDLTSWYAKIDWPIRVSS